MTTKDYLNQINRLNMLVNNKLAEIAQYRELSCSISAVKNEEKVMASPNQDKIGTNIAKIDEMERKLDEIIDDYIDKKNYIISQIQDIENDDYYEILFARYIEKLTFEKIANKTGWCWRQVHRIHAKALKAFEEKYGNEYL